MVGSTLRRASSRYSAPLGLEYLFPSLMMYGQPVSTRARLPLSVTMKWPLTKSASKIFTIKTPCRVGCTLNIS